MSSFSGSGLEATFAVRVASSMNSELRAAIWVSLLSFFPWIKIGGGGEQTLARDCGGGVDPGSSSDKPYVSGNKVGD